MRKLYSRSGITLAEFLMAFFILALTAGGILVSYIRAMELAEFSRDMSRAIQAAQTQMEVIRSTPYDDIFTDYNNTVFPVGALFEGQGTSIVDNAQPNLLEVTVVVGWTKRNGYVYTLADSPARMSTRIYKR